MAKMPYDFIGAGENGAPAVRNVPSPEGEEFGSHLARFAAPRIAETMARFPDSIPPCNECAFVKGTIPNRCLSTVANALKCVVEVEEFYCHKGDQKRLCSGWAAMLTVPETVATRSSASDSAPAQK